MSPRTPSLPPEVTTHIDGSCHPNPGRGGWGVVSRSGGREKRLKGSVEEYPCTNQRAELYAAIHALYALTMPCKVRLYSDSQYVIKTMNSEYRRRANLDLWEALDLAAAPHEVEWIWQRGHAGDQGNRLAHRLAERAVREASREADKQDAEICEPREFDGDIYYCGRLLSRRNVESKAERCPGGTMICPECFGVFDEFMDAAHNANAREAEWEGGSLVERSA